MLYDPAQFDRLSDEPWDEARVRDGIRRIVADCDDAYRPDSLWPAHEWDGYRAPLPLKNLYLGAAGVAWALADLRERGYPSTLDLASVAVRALTSWRAEPDFMEGEVLPVPAEAGLFTAETGPLLVAARLTAAKQFVDDLRELVLRNLDNETEELFWGTPGTLLAAALAGLDDAARASADALASRRDADGLWTQRLWGQEFQAIGASHGAAGNVRALLHVDDPRNEVLKRDTAALLADRARCEDGLANWGDGRVQWCVGAPGIVVCAWDYLDEELLLAAAELVWQAGPHGDEKGAGICHGTAGNGFALLKAFARTGDEVWLERARRFAMHALGQVERLPARYSLFTGGVGAALFLAACVDGEARYPLLDA